MGDPASDDSDGEEIRRIERQRVRALVSTNIQMANHLHAPEYQLIPPSGEALSKQRYLDLLESGKLRYRMFEPLGEIVVRRHGVTAIIRYQVRIEVVVEGEVLPPILAWHTDYYEFQDGRWQAVWSQATKIAAE
jgi:hypothetical protein